MNHVLTLPEHVSDALSLLKFYGYEAYVVGGSVRDLYMGLAPYDYDITTNAKPHEVIEIFSKTNKVIETGIKHGTVTVMYDFLPIEITTYRIDGEYNDCRKPDSVTFTPNLVDDLKRRDFTINALVYDGSENLLDYFSGIEDIKSKIIRCIGNPSERFSEDALRILRALRFSAKLDFDIEENTSDALINMHGLLMNISSERIFSELSTLFSYKNMQRLKYILLKYKPVIETALNLTVSVTDYDEICEKTSLISPENDIGFSYFLASVCSEKTQLQEVLKHLKSSRVFEKQSILVYDLRSHIDEIQDMRTVKLLAKEYGVQSCLAIGAVFQQTGENDILKKFAQLIYSQNMCVSLSQLNITGKDVFNEIPDVEPRKIGDILDKLLLLVIEERIENNKHVLLHEIHNIIKTL